MKPLSLLVASALALSAVASGQVVINEVRIDNPGADVAEYVELYHAGGAAVDLGTLSLLVIGDGTGGSGTLESVANLPAVSLNAGEYFLVAKQATLQIDNDGDGTVDITATPDFVESGLSFENSDNVTHLLVDGFTGASGDDLDANDDGTLDVMPWTAVLDAVGLVESVGSGDLFYGAALGFVDIGPDGTFVPGHVYRSPDGATFAIGSFGSQTISGVLDLVQDTPGQANPIVTPLSLSLSLSTVSEGASDPDSSVVALTGTVSRTGTTGEVTIDLSVDDGSEAIIDSSVIIPDGATESAVFNIFTVNDGFPDGTQTVTVTASAGGFDPDTETFDVTDDGDTYSLVINEAYYVVDPANGDANGDGTTASGTPNAEEFLEILNVSASPIDLTGYTMYNDFGIIHEFRAGTVVNPGCALVVFGGGEIETGITAAFGGAEVQTAFVDGGFSADGLYLSDGGEGVRILNEASTEIFSIFLPDQTGSPTGGSYNLTVDGSAGSGYALHTTLAAAAWSPGTATDGTPFCTVADTISVVISPGTVTEDGAPGSASAIITLSSPIPTGLPQGGQVFQLMIDDETELVSQIGNIFFMVEGADMITLPLDPVNDLDADGTQTVTVTVIGSNYLNGSAMVDVEDDGDAGLTGDLFISEYGEGSSNNKYLEIYNPTEVTIDLDGYLLGIVYNAPANVGEPDNFITFAPGTMLAPGETWVIANPSADPLIPADETNGSISFNGDDGIGLLKGTSGSYTIIDFVGNFDGDPGSGWDVAGVTNATANHTLVRKNFVNEGNTNWDASRGTTAEDSEWIVLDVDDWSSVGIHPNAAAAPDLVITSIQLLPGGTTVQIDFTGPASSNFILNGSATLDDGFPIDITPTGGSLSTDANGDGMVQFPFVPGAFFFQLEELEIVF